MFISRYDVVDLDADGDVARCYAHLVVGLRGHHRDFDIGPAPAPNGYDMLAFREFVRAAYPLTPCRRQEPASRYRASLVVAERGRGSCSSSRDARGSS